MSCKDKFKKDAWKKEWTPNYVDHDWEEKEELGMKYEQCRHCAIRYYPPNQY